MDYATISADVISYTSLTDNEKRKLEFEISKFLGELSEKFHNHGFYGRLVQGDHIECAIKAPGYALRIALLLKSFIKSIDLDASKKTRSRMKYFFEHGIRLAVAIAPLSKLDPEMGIIDGEAIYLSGRTINKYSTSDKQKVVIKSTMFFCSTDVKLQEQFDTLFSLIDTVMSKCSAKQSEVLYLKLLGLSETDIALKLEKSQSTISQHSTAAGWLSIEKAINYFEKSMK